MEALLAKHKKEQRDLISQITGLKKQATKKNRKLVLAQCTDLQAALDLKQKQEIEGFGDADNKPSDETSTNGITSSLDIDRPVQTNVEQANQRDDVPKPGVGESNSKECSTNSFSGENSNEPPNAEEITPEQLLASMKIQEPSQTQLPVQQESQKPKKRNRAKERLAKRQAQIDAIRADALSEAAATPDYRAMEAETMNQLLANRGLEVYEIQPDGHCLFRSLSDQLQLRHSINVTVEHLRSTAAKHIRDNRDEFIPYLFDEETMAIRDPDEYTQELETTAMWGSDMEILALAKEYDCPVEVLTAGSAPITFNAEGENSKLFIAFYKHTYGLGEHYNSCR